MPYKNIKTRYTDVFALELMEIRNNGVNKISSLQKQC